MKRRTHLAGVQVVKRRHADGGVAVHYYHRATRTKLPGRPGEPAFLAALKSAAESRPAPVSGDTVASLIRGYCASGEWRNLADSTRAIERLNLKAVEDKWGTLPLVVFRSKAIRGRVLEWRDELAVKHPRAADAKASAFSRVLAWGVDRELVDGNPLAGIKGVYRSARADLIWLPAHVQAMNATCGPGLRMALLLALHTGQRQGDILALPWSAYGGAAITLRQGKSKRRVYIPCTKALRAALDAIKWDHAPEDTIVTNTRGASWKARAFGRMWERAYTAGGLPDGAEALHFHDLRGTAVTMLSEAGCTPQEIATITGHTLTSVNRILEVYLSRTRALAVSAIEKLDVYQANRL